MFADLITALQRFGAADLIPSVLHDASPAIKVLVTAFVLVVPGMLTAFALFLLGRKLWRLRRDRPQTTTRRGSVEIPAAVAAAEVQMEVVRVLPVVRGR
ncbi:MAG: hypothetical protein JXB32_25305 [Deltaproteobacteria bacterium]|nr:hypothetical protein [Deltaproteobacteria bacterium]